MKASLLAFLIPLVAATPITLDIHVTDDTTTVSQVPPSFEHSNTQIQSPIHTEEEKIPGWIFIEDKSFRARIHGNTFWNIKGELNERLPIEDFLFDPLLFTLNHPEDYTGKFGGMTGKGKIELTWEKSGATMVGRSPIGEFWINGTSKIDYSP